MNEEPFTKGEAADELTYICKVMGESGESSVRRDPK